MTTNAQLAKQANHRAAHWYHNGIRRLWYLENTVLLLLCLVVITTASVFVAQPGTPLILAPIEGIYGSMLFSGVGVGGYLLVGLFCFTLGILFAVICFWSKARHRKNTPKSLQEINEEDAQ